MSISFSCITRMTTGHPATSVLFTFAPRDRLEEFHQGQIVLLVSMEEDIPAHNIRGIDVRAVVQENLDNGDATLVDGLDEVRSAGYVSVALAATML